MKGIKRMKEEKVVFAMLEQLDEANRGKLFSLAAALLADQQEQSEAASADPA